MTAHPHQQRPSIGGTLQYFTFILVAVTLMLIGAVLWILNLEEVVQGSWSNILGVVFTLLGAVLALLQWHAQITERTSIPTAPTPPPLAIPHPHEHTRSNSCTETLIFYAIHTRSDTHRDEYTLHKNFQIIHSIYTPHPPITSSGNY